MSKTTNLGLELTTDSSTLFEDWREAINGEGSGAKKSNMQIIDEFAGSISGVSGSVLLSASNWDEGSYTLIVAALGAHDAIFFSPATVLDKTNIDKANFFVSASGNAVTIIAAAVPTADITLNYFISRGKA